MTTAQGVGHYILRPHDELGQEGDLHGHCPPEKKLLSLGVQRLRECSSLFLQLSEGHGVFTNQTHRLPLKRLPKMKEAHVNREKLIAHSSGNQTPDIFWSTKLAPQSRSEASDQNSRSGRSRETWREDFRRLTTRTDLTRSRVSGNRNRLIQEVLKSPQLQLEGPHTKATPGNKMAERGKPAQHAPPANNALLPARQKFFYL